MNQRTAVLGVLAVALTIGLATGAPVPYDRTSLVSSGSQDGDLFGSAVDISGDSVIVAAPEEESGGGTVYVFERGGGAWTTQQRIDGIGYLYSYTGTRPVAISGNTLVVGTVVQVGNNTLGSAYVFVRSAPGAQWSEVQKLNPAGGGTPSDQFGANVAIDGDTIVVGTRRDKAYVFTRPNQLSLWGQQQEITLPTDTSVRSVDVGGDTLVVGASGNLGGSAEVYLRTGTTWSLQQSLTVGDPSAAEAFGESVGVSGNTVVVGSKWEDGVAGENSGAAYTFLRTGTVWSVLPARLIASDAAPNHHFGTSVAIDGDTVVVGAPTSFGASTSSGAVYVFVRTDESDFTWEEQARLPDDEPAVGSGLGRCVSVSGNRVAAGRGREDDQRSVGNAFVFEPGSGGGGGGGGPVFRRDPNPLANPAFQGQPITFTALATAPSPAKPATVAYEWHFGDGMTQEAGPRVTHTYAAAGSFGAFVRATGPGGEFTDSDSRTIVIFAQGTPFFDVAKAKVALKLNAAGKDKIAISGKFPLADGTALLGKVLTIDFGGVAATFTLDAKGKSPKGAVSARVFAPKGGVARYAVKLTGDYAALLADEGMTDATVQDVDATTHVAVTFDGVPFAEDYVLFYAATADRKGSAR